MPYFAGRFAHRVDPKLHRVLDEEVPRTGRLENVDAVMQNAYTLFRGYLDAHSREIDIVDLDLAAFILVTTVEALTHSAVLHRPDMLVGEKAAMFLDEATRLVLGYLRTPSPRREGARASARGSRRPGVGSPVE
jgi:Tetracyclin repressor-like, C-terminal domain